MSKKKIRAVLKLELQAGKATPAPPVGTALGPHGINIMEFTKAYTERAAPQAGDVVPAEITIYEDRSFTFILKTPPAVNLLKRAAGSEKGSAKPNREKVGSVTRSMLRNIVEAKRKDLNAYDSEAAMKMIEGTARSMGLEVIAECRRKEERNTSRRPRRSKRRSPATATGGSTPKLPAPWSRRRPSPSSMPRSRLTSGSGSTLGMPSRWSGARSSCPTGPARRCACWCSPPPIRPRKRRKP